MAIVVAACNVDSPSALHEMRLAPERLQAHFNVATQQPRGAEDVILTIDQATQALGGLYFDDEGALVVNVVDAPGERAAIAAATRLLTEQPMLGLDQSGRPRRVRVERVRHRFSNLVAYQAVAASTLRSTQGVTQTDADERSNMLRVGVKALGVRSQVMQRLLAAGIPADAIEIVLVEEVRPAASVRDKFRPTGGGIQIWAPHLAVPICTLGYNVTQNGQRYVLTNSHCVGNRDGLAIGLNIYQNTNTGANLIGTVALDPPWNVVDPGCSHPVCRRSDAALVAYSAGISAPSQIAKTTNVGTSSPGSLTFSSWLTVIDPLGNEPFVGLQNIYKVGRTSGTTSGTVVESCVNVPGTGFSVLCSDIVEAWADSGDSGSPVFWFPYVLAPSNRIPMGILYGIRTGPTGQRQFAFSRLSQIASELGSLVYH